MTAAIIHVVDNDDAIRHSLALMLTASGYDVHTWPDGEAFLSAVDTPTQACILLDIRMPGMSGLDVQAELRRRFCACPVIFLTGHGDVPLAVSAIRSGASDFLEKPVSSRTLLAAIASAFDQWSRTAAVVQKRQQARKLMATLTDREREVLDRLLEGRQNKEIAASLGISPRTIEIHRAHIMEKLHASNLTEALLTAIKSDDLHDRLQGQRTATPGAADHFSAADPRRCATVETGLTILPLSPATIEPETDLIATRITAGNE